MQCRIIHQSYMANVVWSSVFYSCTSEIGGELICTSFREDPKFWWECMTSSRNKFSTEYFVEWWWRNLIAMCGLQNLFWPDMVTQQAISPAKLDRIMQNSIWSGDQRPSPIPRKVPYLIWSDEKLIYAGCYESFNGANPKSCPSHW